MFVVKPDNEEWEIIEETEAELNVLELAVDSSTCVELSINSVVRLTNLGTMKMHGKIRGREIVELIDCGATHNFISEKLVNEIKLQTKETSHYWVILGSRAAVKGKGICEAIEVFFNEWKLKDDFLPLELGGVDLILEMSWLYSLGVIVVDWRNLLMTFVHQGKKVNLKGDPSLPKARVSLKNMIKSWD